MHLSQAMWKKLSSLSAQVPSPPSAQIYCRLVIYHCSLRNSYAVADLQWRPILSLDTFLEGAQICCSSSYLVTLQILNLLVHSKILNLRPPLCPVFFIFMQISEIFGQIIGWLPLSGRRSISGKSWIWRWCGRVFWSGKQDFKNIRKWKIHQVARLWCEWEWWCEQVWGRCLVFPPHLSAKSTNLITAVKVLIVPTTYECTNCSNCIHRLTKCHS